MAKNAVDIDQVVGLIQALAPAMDVGAIQTAVASWLDNHPEATTTVTDGSITEAKLAAAVAQKLGLVTQLSDLIALQEDSIPGTTQTITFDADGDVQRIVHSSGNTAVRTDVFTFGTDTITEVRTLASGASLTIVTNTDTLVTTVTMTAA